MVNRRSFIGALGALAATMVLDPDRALWVQGAKTISIPAPGVTWPDNMYSVKLLSGLWVKMDLREDEDVLALLARARGVKSYSVWI